MAIARADLEKVFKSTIVNDTVNNGGRMSAVESVDGASDNLFPPAGEAERTAGSTKYRKAFFKNSNDDDELLTNALLYMEKNTPGDDAVVMFLGTQEDVQNDIDGTEDLYGTGVLDSLVSAGANTIDVVVEDGAEIIFRDTEKIRISDKTGIDDLVGNEEIHTINGVPVVNGDVVTITLAGTLANGYAAGSQVSSFLEVGDVQGAFSSFVVTSAGDGTYDEVNNPILVDNIGGVRDTWTLTFQDATNFTISGANSGSVGSGTIGSNTSPNNGDFSRPYWTIFAAGFGGTFQAGDTIEFVTDPAAVGVWFRRVIPAGANPQSGNSFNVRFRGETG